MTGSTSKALSPILVSAGEAATRTGWAHTAGAFLARVERERPSAAADELTELIDLGELIGEETLVWFGDIKVLASGDNL